LHPLFGVEFAIIASMRILYFFVLLTLSLSNSKAAAFDLYDNKVFEAGIRTTTLHPVGYPFGTPLIQLGTQDVLTLQFDEIGDDVSDFRYAIVQCDHKWQATDVSTFDYIDGFSDGYLNDYDFSFNTTYSYVHYQMNIPNEDFQITQSGNYAVVIFRDDVEEPVLTRRFMVVRSKVIIEGGVAVTRNPSLREKYQEIVFNVDHEGFGITNPFQEINVVVTQNDRWDNAIYSIKPLHINENQLLFTYNMKIAFPTGREFREMDIRTLRYRTEGVRAIDQRDSANLVYLMPDPIRRTEDYRAEGDLNGKYLIDRQEGRYAELEADYAWVHFNLPFETAISNGSFYVVGGFNDYQLSDENKMEFDERSGSFNTAIFMKQGFYNYMYVFVEDGKEYKDHSFTEGNYYDTENDYAVYVYYRPFGQRYDELIGFSFLNTKLTRY